MCARVRLWVCKLGFVSSVVHPFCFSTHLKPTKLFHPVVARFPGSLSDSQAARLGADLLQRCGGNDQVYGGERAMPQACVFLQGRVGRWVCGLCVVGLPWKTKRGGCPTSQDEPHSGAAAADYVGLILGRAVDYH